MEKIIYFDYCALGILVILFVSTIFRQMTKGRLNRCFMAMLVVFILSVLADIVAIHLDKMGPGNETAKYISHALYLLLHNLTPAAYIIYLVAQTDTWHKFNQSMIAKMLLGLPLLVEICALLWNPVSHEMFYLDENGTYTRGSQFLLLYIVAIIYVGYGAYYIYHYRKLFNKRRYVALLSLYPFMICAVVVQYFFPEFIVEMFASASGILFISMMIQRPEETIDVETGLGKLSAYVTDMRRAFVNKKPVEIIFINIANYETVREVLGYDGMNEMLRQIADNLVIVNKKHGLEAELYYLGNGKYRFVIDSRHFDKTEEAAQFLNSMMKEMISFNQMDVNLVTYVCIANCPEDIDDVEALLAFGAELHTETYTGDVLYASEIYKKEYYDIRKDIDQIIEGALAERKFEVYYQPIYSVKEQRFNSAEALLRLKDDRYGFVSPEIFIPAAEKSGAIHRIGAFVLEEVCQFIASEEYKTLHLDYIEINLSVVQCMQNDLAKQILDTLAKYRIATDQINLEITETAASNSQKTMMENLNILNAAGVSFSLDDFGTGYSNMRRIASLPLHIVKLDKSFANVEENPRLQIVLKNTIKMIKAMNMEIVVEGVEDERLVKQFSDWKCEYIQGYYYSKPIPKEQFIDFVQTACA